MLVLNKRIVLIYYTSNNVRSTYESVEFSAVICLQWISDACMVEHHYQ